MKFLQMNERRNRCALKKGQTYFNLQAIRDLFIKTKAFAIVTVWENKQHAETT